jgi:hypothetical protein
MVGKDPNEALAAAKRLPEGGGRKAGIDAVLAQIASSNVEEAQKLMTELPPNSVTGAGAAIAVALVRQTRTKRSHGRAHYPKDRAKTPFTAAFTRMGNPRCCRRSGLAGHAAQGNCARLGGRFLRQPHRTAQTRKCIHVGIDASRGASTHEHAFPNHWHLATHQIPLQPPSG